MQALHEVLRLLFLFAVVHAVCDFPLQGDFLAQLKNPTTAFGQRDWKWGLIMHGLIQAGGVFLITQSLTLAIVEFFAHMGIDQMKSYDVITFSQDQILHLACKFAYVSWILTFPQYFPHHL